MRRNYGFELYLLLLCLDILVYSRADVLINSYYNAGFGKEEKKKIMSPENKRIRIQGIETKTGSSVLDITALPLSIKL